MFTESLTYNVYRRTNLTLVDVLSEAGGLFTSLSAIGAALSIAFNYNLMMASIMKTLYHFTPRFPSESRINRKKVQKYLDKKEKEKGKENFFGEQDDHGDNAFAAYQKEEAKKQHE